ncbi:MAG: hypothetical protein QGG40_11850, partial [Myxococcota bacterium]|nr:hypothetical protein [Myxococcota bacterium]
MADLTHLVQRYGAARGELQLAGGTSESVSSVGGDLIERVEELGVIGLVQTLAQGDRLVLEDPGVSLEIRVADTHAVLRVAWADGPSYEERLEVPTVPAPPTPVVAPPPRSPEPAAPEPVPAVAPPPRSPDTAAPEPVPAVAPPPRSPEPAAPEPVAPEPAAETEAPAPAPAEPVESPSPEPEAVVASSALVSSEVPLFDPDPSSRVGDIRAALHDPSLPLFFTPDGAYTRGTHGAGTPLLAQVPPVEPGQLGSAGFRQTHGVRASYIAGAMAGGIGSAEMVIAMGKAGMLGFFGAGGLPLDAVREGVRDVKAELGDRPAGFNLLHNPAEPTVEEDTVDLYLEHGVRMVSASAFMVLTPAVVRYRL